MPDADGFPFHYSQSTRVNARLDRDVERTGRTLAPRTCCSIATHEAIKLDDAAWNALEYRGVMLDVDDEGNDASIELRNHTCGSTIARLVRS